jgi:type I restriction enzyme S subunit
LGELVQPSREMVQARTNGGRYLGLEHIEPHTTRITGTADPSSIKGTGVRFKAGDTLYARLRPYLNKTCVPDFDGVASGEFIVFQAVEWLAPRFLMYFLHRPDVVAFANAKSTGTHRPRVKWDDFADLAVGLPPLAEQRRIVGAIEELFSRIDAGAEALNRVRRNLQRMYAAVLQAAVTGRLVPQDPNDEPAEKFVRRLGISSAPGPEVPLGWCWLRLGDAAIVGSGATPLKSRRDYYDGGTIPWVTSSMLNAEFVDRPSDFITERALQETSVKLWPPHTLLVAMYGEGQTRGKCSELLIEAATNQACAAIVLEGEANALRPFVKLHFAANYEANRRLASGGVQPNLSLGLIKSQMIALPPLREQQRILAEGDRQLSIARAMEETLVRNLKGGNHLRHSILARAFSGRLAPQDPLDEPASAILDHVKGSRNNGQPNPNPSRGGSRR